MHFLREYLPPRGQVLDAGGGPGRDTIELARMGYDVVLQDLTPELLDIARQEIRKAGVGAKVRKVTVGSIDDMSGFPDRSFDAVLCLGGPLSHLVERRRRLRAISELVRIARRRAPIFISVMGRLALCAGSAGNRWSEMKDTPRAFWRCVLAGDYHGGHGFTATHFYLPEELAADIEGKARVLTMVGLEGVFSAQAREYNLAARSVELAPGLRRLHMMTCTHAAVVGMSGHILAVCRK